MDAYLDPALGALLWMALSLPVMAFAAQLCFAWPTPAPARDRPAWLCGLAGAGLSLGAGLWSVHGIATQANIGGGTDASAIQRAGTGALATTIGAPVRYMHSTVQLCHRADIEATIEGRFELDELSRLGLAFEG